MLIGLCVALLGVAFNLAGASMTARHSAGNSMPAEWRRHAIRPSRRVRRLHTAGWIASIVGALAIGDALWNSRPGSSIAIVIAILVLVNGLPSLLVTMLHLRRAQS